MTLSELFNPEKLQIEASDIYKKYTWEAAHHEEFDDDGDSLDLSYLLSSGAGLWEGFPGWITMGTSIPSSAAEKEKDIKTFISTSRTLIANELIVIIEILRYRTATKDKQAYNAPYTQANENLNQIWKVFIDNKLLNCSINDFMNACSNAISIIFKQIEKDGLEYMYKYIDDGDGYYNSIVMFTFPKYKLARIIYNGEHQTPLQTTWDWCGTCQISPDKTIICNSQKDDNPKFRFKLIIKKHDLDFIDENKSFKKYLDDTIGAMNIYIPKKLSWIYKK